jgi:hypothetical protein
MKTIYLIILIAFPAASARAGAFDDLLGDKDLPAVAALPDPLPVEAARSADVKEACPAKMNGDASVPCFITTPKTTVCADGARISTARISAKDVKSGKFPASELGKYKDQDLREWAEYQKKLGKDGRWSDGSHQNSLATGKVDPLKTAYVVLPNRDWLGRGVTVCLTGTKVCTEAKALEVGPKSTFRDHSEISVRALMDLGLDANPDSGTYNGEVTFIFH